VKSLKTREERSATRTSKTEPQLPGDILLCRGSDADNCLTAPQVDAVKMAYEPAKTKRGELIYTGLAPGASKHTMRR
jgi:hypothetical protein